MLIIADKRFVDGRFSDINEFITVCIYFFQFIWDSIGMTTYQNSNLQQNRKMMKSLKSYKAKEKKLADLYR